MLTAWLALLPAVLLASMVPLGRVALGVGLAATAALSAWALRRVRAGQREYEPGDSSAVALTAFASLLLAVSPTLLAPAAERVGHDAVYDLGVRLLFVLYGWGAALTAIAATRGAPASMSGSPPSPRSRHIALIVGGAFIWLACAHALYVGRYAGPGDEVLYLLQSRLLGEPGFVRHIDPAVAPFFTVRQMAITDGRIFTQYPPGWPAALALFDVLGARWWSGVVLGTLGVWLTYLLGRRLHSPFVGAVAATLLAASYWFVQAAATYGAHTMTLGLVTAAALLLLAGEASRGIGRVLAWLGAGLLLGVAVTVRPLTGVGAGFSLVLFVALRRRLRPAELAGMAAGLAAGGIGPALALLAYNSTVYGSPWTIGYRAVNGALHDLGFGLRGFQSYDPRGCPTTVAAPFTALGAVSNLSVRAWEIVSLALPPFLLPPLLAATRGTAGSRSRWVLVASFFVLPAIHFFYFFSQTRFYTELFPFLFVGVALLIADAWHRNAVLGRTMLTLGLAAAVVHSALWLVIGAVTFGGRMAAFDAVEQARREHGRVVVFVADTSTATRGAFYALYGFNVDRFPGDVVVARDLGPANHVLADRLPGYVLGRLVWDPSGAPVVAPLANGPGDAPPSTCGMSAPQPH